MSGGSAARTGSVEPLRLIMGAGSGRISAWLSPELRAIVIATIALSVACAEIAPQSSGAGAIANKLPFAAILAVVAIGQTFVIQQVGIDLSAPGTVSLSVVLMTKLPQGRNKILLTAGVVLPPLRWPAF